MILERQRRTIDGLGVYPVILTDFLFSDKEVAPWSLSRRGADCIRAFARIENHYFVNKVCSSLSSTSMELEHYLTCAQGFFPEDGYLIKESQIAKM